MKNKILILLTGFLFLANPSFSQAPPIEDQGQVVSEGMADSLAAAFQVYYCDEANFPTSAATMSAENIQAILDQDGVHGITFYFGANPEDPSEVWVLCVGTKEDYSSIGSCRGNIAWAYPRPFGPQKPYGGAGGMGNGH